MIEFGNDVYCRQGSVDVTQWAARSRKTFEELREIAEDPFFLNERDSPLTALATNVLDALFTRYTATLGIDGLKTVYFYDIPTDDDTNDNNLSVLTTIAHIPASESPVMERLHALLRFAGVLYQRGDPTFFTDKQPQGRRGAFCDFLYFLLSRKQDDSDATFEKHCFWADLFTLLARLLRTPPAASSGPLFLSGYLNFARVLGDPRVVCEPRNAPMLCALVALLGRTQRVTLDLLRVLAGPGVLLHPAAATGLKAEVLRVLRRQGCYGPGQDVAQAAFFDALFEAEARAQSYEFTCQLLKYLTQALNASATVGDPFACGEAGLRSLVFRINPVSYTTQTEKLRLFRLSLNFVAAALRSPALSCACVRDSICRNERVGYILTDVLRTAGNATTTTAVTTTGPAQSTAFLKCALAALRLAEAIVRAGHGADRHMREALAPEVLLPLVRPPTTVTATAANTASTRLQAEVSFAAAKNLKLGIAAATAADGKWGTPAALEAVLSEAFMVLFVCRGGADPRLANEVVKLVVRACMRGAPGHVCADLRSKVVGLVAEVLRSLDATAPLTKNALRLILLELRNGVPCLSDALGTDFVDSLARLDTVAPFKTAVLLLNTSLACGGNGGTCTVGEAGVLRTITLFERTFGVLSSPQQQQQAAGTVSPKYLANLASLAFLVLEAAGSPCDPRISLALLGHATCILGTAPGLRRFALGILDVLLMYMHNNRAAAATTTSEEYLASFEEELALVNTLFHTLHRMLKDTEPGADFSRDDVLRVLLGVLKLNKAYYLSETYAAAKFSFFSAIVVKARSAAFQNAAATLGILVPSAAGATHSLPSDVLLKDLRLLFALLAECPEAKLYDIPAFEPFFTGVLEGYLTRSKALLTVSGDSNDNRGCCLRDDDDESLEGVFSEFRALGKLLLAVVGLAGRAPPAFAASLVKVLADVLGSDAVAGTEKVLAAHYFVEQSAGSSASANTICEDRVARAHNVALASLVAVTAAATAQCAYDTRLLAQCHQAILSAGTTASSSSFFSAVLATQPAIVAASTARLELVRNAAELYATVLTEDTVTPSTDSHRYEGYKRDLAPLLATLAENSVFWPTHAPAHPEPFLAAAQAAFFLAKALLGLYRSTATLCVAADSVPTLAAFLGAAARATLVWASARTDGSGCDSSGTVETLEAVSVNTVEAALYLLVHHIRALPMEEKAKAELLESLKQKKISSESSSSNSSSSSSSSNNESVLETLRKVAPRSKFDAFPKMIQYLEDPTAFC